MDTAGIPGISRRSSLSIRRCSAAVGRLLGDFPLAGVLISLASGAVAFEFLWRLALPRIGASGAMRTTLYLGLFPMSVFLSAVYTESLFLALCIGAFFLAERGHWTWASVAAGGTMLTRSIGLAVVVGLALLAWPSIRNVAWLLLAPAIFAVFPSSSISRPTTRWRSCTPSRTGTGTSRPSARSAGYGTGPAHCGRAQAGTPSPTTCSSTSRISSTRWCSSRSFRSSGRESERPTRSTQR